MRKGKNLPQCERAKIKTSQIQILAKRRKEDPSEKKGVTVTLNDILSKNFILFFVKDKRLWNLEIWLDQKSVVLVIEDQIICYH